MRIIAGRFRGHPLVSFKADHLRPTTDRVKESIFNTFAPELAGAEILDLFSGTGNLGLEALSREASHCTFVDLHPKSIEILKRNLQKLKVEASEYTVIKKDVRSWLKSEHQKRFDLIFVDPPFTQKMADGVLTLLAEAPIFHEKTRIAIESTKHETVEDRYGSLFRYKFKSYGDKNLSLFHVEES